jgi:hypothetical protein
MTGKLDANDDKLCRLCLTFMLAIACREENSVADRRATQSSSQIAAVHKKLLLELEEFESSLSRKSNMRSLEISQVIGSATDALKRFRELESRLTRLETKESNKESTWSIQSLAKHHLRIIEKQFCSFDADIGYWFSQYRGMLRKISVNKIDYDPVESGYRKACEAGANVISDPWAWIMPDPWLALESQC